MEDVLLNNSLKLPCPEGFHVMDDEERSELNIMGNGPGVCLSNPERHIIVSIGWQQVGGLTSLLLKSGDIRLTQGEETDDLILEVNDHDGKDKVDD